MNCGKVRIKIDVWLPCGLAASMVSLMSSALVVAHPLFHSSNCSAFCSFPATFSSSAVPLKTSKSKLWLPSLCNGSPHASLVSEDPASEQMLKPQIEQLFSVCSAYNEITIIEVPQDMPSEFAGSRLLLLDESGNVHSIYKHDCKWTDSYWDQFAALPAIVPDGPIAILGLGGGTTARLLLDVWPSCRLLGWEIDEILVDAARMYFGLSDLEVTTVQGGGLQVYIDDALLPSATVEGGFAGIIVDLFSNGQILPQLKQPETWFELRQRLRDGGRIMINCGGVCVEKSDSRSEMENGTWTWEDGGFAKDATLRAIFEAFPGQTMYRNLGSGFDNYLALTGPFPDFQSWAASLPKQLQAGLSNWRAFNL